MLLIAALQDPIRDCFLVPNNLSAPEFFFLDKDCREWIRYVFFHNCTSNDYVLIVFDFLRLLTFLHFTPSFVS